jgi:hypothetical protein
LGGLSRANDACVGMLPDGNLPPGAGVLMTGRMQSEAAIMGLFYLTLFIVMCIFGWSVRGAGG